MNTLYFIGAYKNNMHYSDGVDVWELTDYRAGFYPTFNKTLEETWEQHFNWIDEVTKLSEDQKLRYDKSYADLPKLLEIYKLQEFK